MTTEALDRPTRRRIARTNAKKEKRRVFVRDEWRTGSGITITPWRELIDDPKHGVHDLSNWIKKYEPFGGRYASRNARPMRREASERTFWYNRDPDKASTSLSPFPYMTNEDQAEFDTFFDSQENIYLWFIDQRIANSELRDDLKPTALEAIYDGLRMAYFTYDPARPPKYRPDNGGEAKSASRETYFARVANNVLSDFISIVNADKRGFRYAHSYLTSKPDEEVGENEVNEGDIAEERRNTVRDMIFRIDVDELRRRLAPEVCRVFDLLMDGHPHYQICNLLGVSNDKYRLRYLSPIQKVAIEIGFIPSDFRGMVDKMFVFKYKIRESIRAHKGESGR